MCVCVSPKDVITMVIQKPVDYVVEKLWLIYTLPLVRYIQYTHILLCSAALLSFHSLFLNHALFLRADTRAVTV